MEYKYTSRAAQPSNINETKGPGPQGQEGWSHIQFQVWGHCLQ